MKSSGTRAFKRFDCTKVMGEGERGTCLVVSWLPGRFCGLRMVVSKNMTQNFPNSASARQGPRENGVSSYFPAASPKTGGLRSCRMLSACASSPLHQELLLDCCCWTGGLTVMDFTIEAESDTDGGRCQEGKAGQGCARLAVRGRRTWTAAVFI